VGDYVHTIGDAHIYNNHVEPMKELLEREPLPLPSLIIDEEFDLQTGLQDRFPINSAKWFSLNEYQYHPEIKMPMAV
jgi:thymidylate synthase